MNIIHDHSRFKLNIFIARFSMSTSEFRAKLQYKYSAVSVLNGKPENLKQQTTVRLYFPDASNSRAAGASPLSALS